MTLLSNNTIQIRLSSCNTTNVEGIYKCVRVCVCMCVCGVLVCVCVCPCVRTVSVCLQTSRD